MNISFIQKLVDNNKELIKYGIVGIFCAGVDFLIYTALNIKFNVLYLYANIISVNVGILSSFFLNRYFTFNVKDKIYTRLFYFYLIGLTGLGISTALLYTLVETLAVNKIISKLLTIIVVALVQFCLNKFITFKKK